MLFNAHKTPNKILIEMGFKTLYETLVKTDLKKLQPDRNQQHVHNRLSDGELPMRTADIGAAMLRLYSHLLFLPLPSSTTSPPLPHPSSSQSYPSYWIFFFHTFQNLKFVQTTIALGSTSNLSSLSLSQITTWWLCFRGIPHHHLQPYTSASPQIL